MSGIQALINNGHAVYNFSNAKAQPEFLKEAKSRSLKIKQLSEYRGRIELLQDFRFTSAATNICVSEDGNYIFAAGIYPPSIKIYDLSNISVKCERGLNAQVVKLLPLSDDYKKIALLLDDRNIELHAQYGRHFRIRIPKFGRDLAFNKYDAEILICGSAPEIYRLNLEQGRFTNPLVSKSSAYNSVVYNSKLNLISAGSEEGNLDIFDSRTSSVIHSHQEDREITSQCFDETGLSIVVGYSNGKCTKYDMRYPKPMLVFDCNYNKPIKKIVQDREFLAICDSKILKLYNFSNGELITYVEPNKDINDFAWQKGTGLILLALESTKMEPYFIPRIGVAPKWCASIEGITEELEQGKTDDDNLKFVTKEDLLKYNITQNKSITLNRN